MAHLPRLKEEATTAEENLDLAYESLKNADMQSADFFLEML